MRRTDLVGRRFVELHTSLEVPFVVPAEFVSQEALARLSPVLRRAVEEEYSGAEFTAEIERLLGPGAADPVVRTSEDWDNAVAVLRVLFGQLAALHPEGGGGVWAEIIENRFAPLFMGKFDLVIGNPPWLTWTKLPEAWRRRAEQIWRDYGMYRSPAVPGVEPLRSLQSSDIAVLVMAVALEHYLKRGGRLAFVTPKSVISGDPSNRAFRQYHLSSDRDARAGRPVDVPFRLLTVQDFSEVRPFSPDASNEPIVLVVQTGIAQDYPIPGSRWSRRGPTLPDRTWDVVRSSFLMEEKVNWQPIATYAASPLAWWRLDEPPQSRAPGLLSFGKGFDTRGANAVYFVEPRGTVRPDGLIRIANLPDRGRRRSGAPEVRQEVGEVEAKFVHAAVRGQDVMPFNATPSTYVLVPYSPTDLSVVLSPLEIQSTALYGFLRQFKPALRERSSYQNFRITDEFWWQLDSMEYLGGGGFRVCVQEISQRPAAAVLRPSFDQRLGRVAVPLPDHKVSFFRTSSESEALFLAALINCDAVQGLLGRFANFLAIAPQTLRYLGLPAFDPRSNLHAEIARMSLEAHDQPDVRDARANELEPLCRSALGLEHLRTLRDN